MTRRSTVQHNRSRRLTPGRTLAALTIAGALISLPAPAFAAQAPSPRPPEPVGVAQFPGTALNPTGGLNLTARPTVDCSARGLDSVTREQILARGWNWVSAAVPYDQSTCHSDGGAGTDSYRMDCSGFVSMAWGLPRSYSTADFARDTASWSTISWNDLQPGDAIVKGGGHIILFTGWADSAKSVVNLYEENWYNTPKGEVKKTLADTRAVASLKSTGYHPIRYRHIDEVPGPRFTNAFNLNDQADDTTDHPATYGQSGDVPVVGDWNGDGRTTIGVVRNGNTWLANDQLDGSAPEHQRVFGQPGDIPVVGDWNGDGKDTPGVYRNGTWYLIDSWSTSAPVRTVHFGVAGDIPLPGDWDGNGTDTPGVYRTVNAAGAFYGSNGFTGANNIYFQYGNAGDRPVAGNWDGTGGDTIGIARPVNGVYEWHLTNKFVTGQGIIQTFRYGTANSYPLAGDWDASKADSIGVGQ
jgi:hypothetical protein